MADLIVFVGEVRTWVPGHGFLEPGQYVDVDEENAARLIHRRDFRRPEKPSATRRAKRGGK